MQSHIFASILLNCYCCHGRHRSDERELKRFQCFAFRSDLDLAVLGCNVSAESMQLVEKVIEDISPRLNLSRNPSAKNSSPVDVTSYLMRNPVRFCVLVVDEGALRNAYESSSERRFELEELVRTAADKVGKNETCVLRPLQ